MLYEVILGQVASDKIYKVGESLELSQKQAVPLISLGYLKAVEESVKTPDPENNELPTTEERVSLSLEKLNSLSEQELEALPGIGEAKAKALFNQAFTSLDDAQKAAGMSDSKWGEVLTALGD